MSSPDARRRLIENARYEVIPLKSLHDQIPHLPAGCSVSVTCSPTKGIEPTLELSAELNGAGHHAVPHIAARLVTGRDHVEKIAARLNEHAITRDLRRRWRPRPGRPLRRRPVADARPAAAVPHRSHRRLPVVSRSPHGHPRRALDEALLAKQALIAELGLQAFTSTQMCFNVKRIEHWLVRQRARGFVVPVHLGVPGAVDRARLLSLGTRLGIGSSLRYLRKNSGAILRMFSPKSYDPNKLITPISRRADELNITGLHVFTFNSIESTAAWQRKSLS